MSIVSIWKLGIEIKCVKKTHIVTLQMETAKYEIKNTMDEIRVRLTRQEKKRLVNLKTWQQKLYNSRYRKSV